MPFDVQSCRDSTAYETVSQPARYPILFPRAGWRALNSGPIDWSQSATCDDFQVLNGAELPAADAAAFVAAGCPPSFASVGGGAFAIGAGGGGGGDRCFGAPGGALVAVSSGGLLADADGLRSDAFRSGAAGGGGLPAEADDGRRSPGTADGLRGDGSVGFRSAPTDGRRPATAGPDPDPDTEPFRAALAAPLADGRRSAAPDSEDRRRSAWEPRRSDTDGLRCGDGIGWLDATRESDDARLVPAATSAAAARSASKAS